MKQLKQRVSSQKLSKQIRKPKGSLLVELASITVMLAILCLMSVDVLYLMMGFSCNDAVCSRAARAASKGPPSSISLGSPQNRAQDIIKDANASSSFITITTNGFAENVQRTPDISSFQQQVDGSVTISTRGLIHLPVPIPGFTSFTVYSTHTYPLTWTSTPGLKQKRSTVQL